MRHNLRTVHEGMHTRGSLACTSPQVLDCLVVGRSSSTNILYVDFNNLVSIRENYLIFYKKKKFWKWLGKKKNLKGFRELSSGPLEWSRGPCWEPWCLLPLLISQYVQLNLHSISSATKSPSWSRISSYWSDSFGVQHPLGHLRGLPSGEWSGEAEATVCGTGGAITTKRDMTWILAAGYDGAQTKVGLFLYYTTLSKVFFMH